MLSKEKLIQLSLTNINDVDVDSLVDIKTVQIDAELSIASRIDIMQEQIKNPYCFRYGNTPVKVDFDTDGEPIEKLLRRFFISLKSC